MTKKQAGLICIGAGIILLITICGILNGQVRDLRVAVYENQRWIMTFEKTQKRIDDYNREVLKRNQKTLEDSGHELLMLK